ncbi:MAG: YidC/Oxa1 family membrane protein insertase [Clostridiales bacterium]|nr:YidC/Oxa1 family membrane protein insertase [Clostridiales bacterium]
MTDILRSIIDAINSVVMNHGWSIAIFTLLIRLVLMPLDVKSRKSMRRMTLIQPEIERLQKKYANDKQKMNMKMSELYKKEKINPLSGCVPMLIQWPILIWMFAAMRAIANEQMVVQVFNYLAEAAQPIANADHWLWVKNVWVADSLFTSMAPDINSLTMVGADVWSKIYQTLNPEQLAVIAGNVSGAIDFSTAEASQTTIQMLLTSLQALPAYKDAALTVDGWSNVQILLFQISLYVHNNGYLVLPILAGVSQVVTSKLTTQQTAGTAQQASQQQSTTKFMQIFFPILSVYFCLTSNAGFAIYWVASNLIMGAQSVLINKYLEKQDEKKKASVAGEGSVK